MRHFLLVLILMLSFQGAGLASEEFRSPAASPEGDAALEQWVASLEPVCEFEVTGEYPGVILELFQPLVERQNAMTGNERLLSAELKSVEVYGTEEEFCAVYTFSCELEHSTDSGNTEREPVGDMTLRARLRQKDRTTYELMAWGGGPIAYGLEPTGLTLENIE